MGNNLKKLKVTDLRDGDILLLHDTKSAKHKLIADFQFLRSPLRFRTGKSSLTHAGIYSGDGKILEASGAEGLRDPYLIEKSKGYKYRVWRLTKNNNQGKVSATAADFARKNIDISESGKVLAEEFGQPELGSFGSYSKSKVIKGYLRSSKRGKFAEKAVEKLIEDPYGDGEFYCSEFVARCYEYACKSCGQKPVIDVDFRHVTVKELRSRLKKSSNWTCSGLYTV